MSDISRNAFIESLALPNLPISTIQATPPGIAIEIDPETVYSLHSSPEPTPIPLPDNNNEVTFPKPPSPHSGLTILHAFRTGGPLSTFKKLPKTSPTHSPNTSRTMRRWSLTSGGRMPIRRTLSPTSTNEFKNSETSTLKYHHHPQGSSKMRKGFSTSTSHFRALKPEPIPLSLP